MAPNARAVRERASPRSTVNAAAVQNLQAWLSGEDVVDADEARLAAELGRRLRGAGLPVDRLALHMGTLHPEVPGRAICWRPSAPVEIYDAEHGVETDVGREPIRLALQCGEAVLVLAGVGRAAGPPASLGGLDERADQVVLPLAAADGPLSVVWLATERPGGFVGAELRVLGDLAPRLRTIFELRALRSTELPVLDSYCGRTTARRVLAQHLHAGRPETLEAAWLWCRLGGDSGLAAEMDPAAQLERLTRLILRLDEIGRDRGGLVLKTFDDGALAVFCRDDAGGACAAALDTARQMLRAEPAHGGADLALHYGRLSYGGAPAHPMTPVLLGPAPILLDRVLTACAALRQPLLLTAAFARHLAPGCARSLAGRAEPGGEFELHVLAAHA